MKLRVLSFLTLLLTVAALRAAEEVEDKNPLEIELVSEVTSIQPGKPFYAALHLKHPEGYHTYWKEPGIVGVPTGIKWKLPKGWKADAIEWPEPELIYMFQIKAQGYHGERVLPIKLTPPNDLTAGTNVTLSGLATWMCCGRDCNPGYEELTMTVPVKAEAPAADKRWQKLFAEARAAKPAELEGWAVKAKMEGKVGVTLQLKPVSETARIQAAKIKDIIFYTEDGFIHSDKDQPLTRNEDGSITMTLAISDSGPSTPPTKLLGQVQTDQGWLAKGAPRTFRIAPAIEP